ncbi:MAG: nucleotide disphospho-sugar-binding domain-containing protein [Asticcacaulis sp.]
MKPRILLAWESGAGRGHVVTLKTVAAALGDGFTYDAALCRMDHAGELAPLCELVFPAARLRYDRARREGPVRTATWGEFLGDSGFRDAAFLARQVGWWKETLMARRSDLVIADYAPCAMLAAQSLGIPAIITGTGYGIVAEGLTTFHVFLPEYTERLYDEAEMTQGINAALKPLGVPELGCMPDIYRRQGELVRTLDMLDPYAGMRAQPLLPPVADIGAVSGGNGDEVFCYFSTSELKDPGVLEAICTLGLPRRAFCPGLDPVVAGQLVAAGVQLENRPVPVDLIAQRSRLMIHSGQHGILSLGLAAGVPQVAIPQHLEQLYHARRCEEQGCAYVVTISDRSSDSVRKIIQNRYEDVEFHQAARQVAARIRPQFGVDPVALIHERIGPLLP